MTDHPPYPNAGASNNDEPSYPEYPSGNYGDETAQNQGNQSGYPTTPYDAQQQNTYGQQAYPAYGQDPYGQNSGNQNPYGQSPYGQSYSGYDPNMYGAYGQGYPAYDQSYGGYGGQPLTVKESITTGWNAFTNNVVPWLGFTLVYFLISAMPSVLAQWLSSESERASIAPGNLFALLALQLVVFVLGLLFTNFALQASFRTLDGERLSFGDFFQLRNLKPFLLVYLALIGITVACLIIIIIGWIALPFVMVALTFSIYAAVDRAATVGESFKTSVAIVKNNLGLVIALILLSIVASVASIITLGLGLLVVLPVSWLTLAYVYRRAQTQLQQ